MRRTVPQSQSHNCPQNAGRAQLLLLLGSCRCCQVTSPSSRTHRVAPSPPRRTLIICKNAKRGPKLLKFNLFLTSTYKFFTRFFFFCFFLACHSLGAFLVACSTLQSFAERAQAAAAANKETGLIHNSRRFCILHYISPLHCPCLPPQFAVLSFAFSFPFAVSASVPLAHSSALFPAYQLSVFELKMPADKFVNH